MTDMTGRRVYIIGEMPGNGGRKKQFIDAEKMLKKSGAIVMNPAVLHKAFGFDALFPIYYAMLDACDSVYLLHGWKDSLRADAMHELAVRSNMEVFSDD